MPHSGEHYKVETVQWLSQRFPKDTRIIDVGAGAGLWFDRLYPTFNNITALEVHEPYIIDYNLRNRYQNVIMADCRYFEFYQDYEVLIMGDVLEHLSKEDGMAFVKRVVPLMKEVVIVVPWLLEQTAFNGVHWEIHQQPDLTEEAMQERYPELELFWKCDRVGIYIKKKT